MRPSLVLISPSRVHQEDRDHDHHGRDQAGREDEEQLVLSPLSPKPSRPTRRDTEQGRQHGRRPGHHDGIEERDDRSERPPPGATNTSRKWSNVTSKPKNWAGTAKTSRPCLIEVSSIHSTGNSMTMASTTSSATSTTLRPRPPRRRTGAPSSGGATDTASPTRSPSPRVPPPTTGRPRAAEAAGVALWSRWRCSPCSPSSCCSRCCGCWRPPSRRTATCTPSRPSSSASTSRSTTSRTCSWAPGGGRSNRPRVPQLRRGGRGRRPRWRPCSGRRRRGPTRALP